MSLHEKIMEYDFLPGLSPEHARVIADLGTETEYPQNAFLLREGAPAETFFLILAGHISLELPAHHHSPLILQTLGPGDILGWSWLIPPHKNRFDAVVREGARVLELDGKDLRARCEADHELGYELLKAVAGVFTARLETTRLRLMDIYGDSK